MLIGFTFFHLRSICQLHVAGVVLLLALKKKSTIYTNQLSWVALITVNRNLWYKLKASTAD